MWCKFGHVTPWNCEPAALLLLRQPPLPTGVYQSVRRVYSVRARSCSLPAGSSLRSAEAGQVLVESLYIHTVEYDLFIKKSTHTKQLTSGQPLLSSCSASRRCQPQFPIQEQLLRRNVKRSRGGLVCKAHRLVYHSTLGSSEISNTVLPASDNHTVENLVRKSYQNYYALAGFSC